MKRFLTVLSIGILMSVSMAQASDHLYMNWDGQQREYVLHVPSTYSSARPTALLFFLHGLGDDIDLMGSSALVTSFAELSGWIIAVPQAMKYTVKIGAYSMPIGACWNAGMEINYMSAKDTLSKGVDDEGFLLALTDTIKAHYAIDNDSVFVSGFSMGGFMTHTMLIRHGDVYSGGVAVSGTIANLLESEQPAYSNRHPRVMHIHSPSDEVVKWNGDFSFGALNVSHIGTSVDSCVNYWRTFNQCNATEVKDTFPDRKADGLLFVRHSYNNGLDSSRVVLVEVQGGSHYWYGDMSKYDISYFIETYNFLADKHIDSKYLDVEDVKSSTIAIYPNPAREVAYLTVENECEATVSDINGRVITRQQCEAGVNAIRVAGLAKGIYLVRVGNNTPAKMIVE